MNASDPVALGALFATPAVCFIVHACASRIVRDRGPQAIAMIAAGLGTLLCAGAAVARGPLDLSSIAYAGLASGALAYTYFHFFNMSETARRIRILRAVYEAGSLSADELSSRYATPDLVRVRLERLAALGEAAQAGDRWVLRRRVLLGAARVVFWWRSVLAFPDDTGRFEP